MAFAYHMEALRKQRIMDRKHCALARIAILQVKTIRCQMFGPTMYGILICLHFNVAFRNTHFTDYFTFRPHDAKIISPI